MSLRAKVLPSISEIPREAWERLTASEPAPAIRWDWIHALEASGSASKKTGWQPAHLTLWRGNELVGAAPAYRKFHSMGEYVYDFAWAQAASSMGVSYYPKLLVGVPLSPITARRLHVAPGENADELRAALLELAFAHASESDCSSVHIIFPPDDEVRALERLGLGLSHRVSMQYHWKNPGYASYDEFLARFDSKRRNQLKRERAAAATQSIALRTVRSPDLTREHADLAYKFYEATNSKNAWGHLQLNRDFFRRAFEAMPQSIEMVLAEHEGRVVAGAFNLATDKRLYGRYWGCFEEFPFLHFHVCLYHSIDDCIRLKREAFEPGAGGEHKISRGFVPTAIHSLHRVFDARLDKAIRSFVERERRQIESVVENGEEVAGMKPWQPRSAVHI